MEFGDSSIMTFLEASATAVGVGMVLGGFAAGLVGVLRKTPRDVLELRVLKVGYLFAAVCLLVRLGELRRII